MENERADIKTRFQKGNNIWQLAKNAGRPRNYDNPEILLEDAHKYFEWATENTLIEIQFHGKDATKCEVDKMRAFTIRELCVFLGINYQTFLVYEKKPEFSEVISHIRDIIWSQKFTGASAGLLNANIIARELGLAEKVNQNIKVGLESENEEEYV